MRGGMDSQTLAALEYDALKSLIGLFLRTPQGRRALAALAPSSDPDEVAARKARAQEAMRHHLEGGRLGPGGTEDPDPVLARLAPLGAVLDPVEIMRLASVMHAADTLRQDLSGIRDRYPRIWQIASGMPDLRAATRQIAGKISSDGRLEDSASAGLGGLRRRIAGMEASLQRSLQSILDRSGERGALQDAYVTLRNGRFVIPVRAEVRAVVPGIVHGRSGTGATVFVEPMETLETNNELVTLREEEAAEITRILTEWSELLRSRLPEIRTACRVLAELDLLGAIAVFGVSYRCTVAGMPDPAGPRARGAARIEMAEARHPVLEAGLRARGDSPVPLTIRMEAAGGVLVLSGPNAGGKTVALKTIGLLALMNQSGLPVPARDSILPIFRRVLADIGDHQSLLESLSTFSARMVRVAEMCRELNPPALVLLDEVGAGTDPEEAGALAVAIVDHFRRRGAAIVATTHHDALKAYAETAPGAINASMEIDEKTMRPTYHLLIGVAGVSSGVDLAARVGLPDEVIADARSRLSSGQRETRHYLSRLQELTEAKAREEDLLRKERQEMAARREALEESMRQRIASLQERWRKEIDAALGKIDQAREEAISSVKDRAIALQLKAEARRQSRTLREQLEAALDPPAMDLSAGAPPAAHVREPPPIQKGSRVRLEGLGGQGEIATVESVDAKGRAEVLVRGKRMTVRARDLKPLEPVSTLPRKQAWTLPAGVRLERGGKMAAPSEIKLIGATVEEALEILDKFLDDAYLEGHRQIRIVHGHGTGRLRAAVRGLLERHPHVESHAPADERSGGEGATLAILRD